MSNTVINGTDILLKVGSEVVACAKSHTITVTMTPRDLASKCTGGWGSKAKGLFTWTGQVDGLVDYTLDDAGDTTRISYRGLFNNLKNGTIVTVVSTGSGTGAYVLTGQALITSLDTTAGDGENATFSCTFEGASSLVLTTL